MIDIPKHDSAGHAPTDFIVVESQFRKLEVPIMPGEERLRDVLPPAAAGRVDRGENELVDAKGRPLDIDGPIPPSNGSPSFVRLQEIRAERRFCHQYPHWRSYAVLFLASDKAMICDVRRLLGRMWHHGLRALGFDNIDNLKAALGVGEGAHKRPGLSGYSAAGIFCSFEKLVEVAAICTEARFKTNALIFPGCLLKTNGPPAPPGKPEPVPPDLPLIAAPYSSADFDEACLRIMAALSCAAEGRQPGEGEEWHNVWASAERLIAEVGPDLLRSSTPGITYLLLALDKEMTTSHGIAPKRLNDYMSQAIQKFGNMNPLQLAVQKILPNDEGVSLFPWIVGAAEELAWLMKAR